MRAAFLCGLREDAFPRPATPEPFLGDDERRALNAASGLRLRLREDRLDAERYLLYAVASRPTELLALSWHAADDEGEPCVRSLFVDDVLDSFDPRPPSAWSAGCWGPPASRPRWRRPRTRRAPRPRGGAGLARARHGVAARRPRAARHQRALDLVGVGARVLRLVPGEVVRRAPAAPGRARARSRADAARRPRPPRPGGHPARAVRRRPAHARAPRRGPRAAARRSRRARRRRHASRPTPSAGARPCAAWRPTCCATSSRPPAAARPSRRGSSSCASAAPDDPLGPAELAGGELRLQGRIDRIDVSADGGEAIVYDYKGKGAPPQARWIEDANLQVGLYLLALPQLLDLEAVGGLYQPLGRDDDGRPRGLLLDGADPGLTSVSKDRLAPEEFDALLQEVLDAALQAVRGIRSGALVPDPTSCAYRGGCAHPTICRCEAASA